MKKNKSSFISFKYKILLMYERLVRTYESRQVVLSGMAFFLGILWDIFTIGRMDQRSNIVQLGTYTLLTMALVLLELLEEKHEGIQMALAQARQRRFVGTIVSYRIELTHFLLGSLLSAFTIFFVKSASLWSSVAFIFLIGAALVVNELPILRRKGVQIRLCFAVVCMASYLCCLLPLVLKSIGPIPFSLALFLTFLIFGTSLVCLGKAFHISQKLYERDFPILLGTLGAFGIFYMCGWIPPVPLALTKIGIYRDVQRSGDIYELRHRRSPWQFWQKGEQTFDARQGDRIFVFFSVFAPSGFHENLKVKWYYYDQEKGRDLRDTMEVSMIGGRDAGYRGFAYKSRYQNGEWQVTIETADEREIGRLNLTVRQGAGDQLRPMLLDFY